jgi:predicted ATPase
LETIRRAATARVHEIKLAPLARADVTRLIAEALYSTEERVRPLAELVYGKTGGNPFFAIQFLTMLAEERLVVFDPDLTAWTWDMSPILAKSYTDNVVDLLVRKLNQLPETTQNVLKQFACLGNTATVAALALIAENAELEIHA